jgi:hypothetical protein
VAAGGGPAAFLSFLNICWFFFSDVLHFHHRHVILAKIHRYIYIFFSKHFTDIWSEWCGGCLTFTPTRVESCRLRSSESICDSLGPDKRMNTQDWRND